MYFQTMDIFSTIEPIIVKYKPKLLAVMDTLDESVTDEGLAKVAIELHKLLPFAVRMVVTQNALTNVLIANRARVQQLLA